MAHIPQSVLDRQPVLEGLNLRNRGKVRDSYDIPDEFLPKKVEAKPAKIHTYQQK